MLQWRDFDKNEANNVGHLADAAMISDREIDQILAIVEKEFSGLLFIDTTKNKLNEWMRMYLKEELEKIDLIKNLSIKVPALRSNEYGDISRAEEIVNKIDRLRLDILQGKEKQKFNPLKSLQIGDSYEFEYLEPILGPTSTGIVEGNYQGAVEQAGDIKYSLMVNGKIMEFYFSEIKIIKELRSSNGQVFVREIYRKDSAMNTALPGGIDLNSANMNLQIKRDGKGVPLPMAQQDMAQLSLIQGFVPVILEIKPAVNLPILNELKIYKEN